MAQNTATGGNILTAHRGKIKAKSLTLLCSQFAVILKSGTQVVTCVGLLAEQCEDKALREILFRVYEELQTGRSLSSAFERNGGKRMPVTFYEMIRAGESSGNLVETFEALQKNFDKSYKTSSKIKTAMIYPIFVLLVAIVVLVVVMIKVIPELADCFASFGEELPAMTRVTIAFSDFMVDHAVLLISCTAAVIIGFVVAGKTDKGRHALDSFKLQVVLFGKLNKASMAAQFANTLSMLLRSGLLETKALEILSRTYANTVVRDACMDLSDDVENGRNLGRSMRKFKCFPKTLTEMIVVGENTGEMESILETTGEYYDNEADTLTKNLIAKLEPAMLVVVAIFAGFLVISIYLPMFKMYEFF